MSEPGDAALLQRWRDGDRAAGTALFERYYRPVERFFLNKVTGEIRDLVQETFAGLVAGRDRLRDPDRFRPYLFSIAYNVLRAHLRARYRRGTPVDLDHISTHDLDPGPGSMLVDKREQRLLLEGLRTIPIADQTLLELYYWEDAQTADIADVLGIPRGTVKSRLRAARKRLEAELARLAASPEVLASTLSGLETWARKCRERAVRGA
jgi:RNA polymerase sigma-70 factor (ECF subfamily)